MSSNVGGLVGINNGSIEASYTTGSVTVGTHVGGGLVGTNNGPIRVSYSKANVSKYAAVSSGRFYGGLVGLNQGPIRASYATGSVTGSDVAAGLIGSQFASYAITASYAIGAASDATENGGLINKAYAGTTRYSYWDTEASGHTTSAGGAGKTTAELQTPAGYSGIYAGWNLDMDNADGDNNDATGQDEPWDFGHAHQYPALKVDFNGDGSATWQEFGLQRPLEPPFFDEGNSAARSVAENSGSGANIGIPLNATDPEGQPLTYSMSGPSAGFFTIDDSNGQLKTRYTVDYETRAAFTVVVTATDLDFRTAKIVVSISITDVDEGPGPSVDYDTDDDGLIEVSSLAQLHAIHWDLAGSAQPAHTHAAGYFAAFTSPAANMGCRYNCSGYELTANLDFDENGDTVITDADTAYWNGGQGWQPIGSDSSPYTGAFEGNAHIISHLFINRPSSDYVGLFGYINGVFEDECCDYYIKGEIHHLTLDGVKVTGNAYVGGLVGWTNSRVRRGAVEGSVTGNADAVGGLVGHSEGVIHESYTSGSVSGANAVGGLVGHSKGAIKVAYSQSSVSATGSQGVAGGLVGINESSILGAYASGAVTGAGIVGGLVGSNGKTGGRDGSIEASYSSGAVTATGGSPAGGLVGLAAGGGVINSYWNTETSGQSAGAGGVGKTTAELLAPTNDHTISGYPDIYSGWLVNVWTYYDFSDFSSPSDDLWDFGNSNEYPALKSDFDGDGENWPTWQEFGVQRGYNEKPEFDQRRKTERKADEGSAARAKVGRPVKATDPEGDTLTYSLIREGSVSEYDFILNKRVGQLLTRGTLDFEKQKSYTVTMAVSDGKNRRGAPDDSVDDTIIVTIKVGNLNELVAPTVQTTDPDPSPTNNPPVFDDGDSTTRRVDENSPPNTNIGLPVAATDADPTDTVVYTMGGVDSGHFVIDPGSGQIKTKDPLDYETRNTYAVTVTASDGNVGSPTIQVTIEVNNVPEPPAFDEDDSTTRRVDENSPPNTNIGLPVVATDTDGDTHTYTLGGTDAAHFAIISGSGQLQTKEPLDYETKDSYAVTVSVSDGNSGTDSIDVTINVNDVNEPPEFKEGETTTREVAENTPPITDIGKILRVADPEGDTLTFTMSGDDSARFRITSAKGRIRTRAALDYEQRTSYVVTVGVTDGKDADGNPDDSVDDTIEVTITVTNVDDPVSVGPRILAQVGGQIDYDVDDDGLIEVDSLDQLNAIRGDLDGNGASAAPAYALAFPNPAPGMGCPDTDGDAASSNCTGYELTSGLNFNTDTGSDTGGVAVIDSNDDHWNSGKGWQPLGRVGENTFRATFDGNSHTISNLFIDRGGAGAGDNAGDNNVGLFGATGVSGILRNATLAGVNVTGRDHVGALVGLNGGMVINAAASGRVASGINGRRLVGGLVGGNNGLITLSSAATNVSGSGTSGGLVGLNQGRIRAAYATGAVNSTEGWVGGLAGANYDGVIQASYATGAATAPNRTSWVSGLVGNTLHKGSRISHSYWNTTASGRAKSDGGEGKTTSELQSPTDYSGIYANWNLDIDNADGDNNDGTGQDDPWDFGTASDYPTLNTVAASVIESVVRSARSAGAGSTNTDYDADDNGLIEVGSWIQLNAVRWDPNGDGVAEDNANQNNYETAFPDAMAGMGCPVSGGCMGYELTDDLDFDSNADGVVDINDHGGAWWDSGAGWSPLAGIGNNAFNATFEGNGHTISNLLINRPSYFVGLFRYIGLGGIVRNLGLKDANVTGGKSQVGVLAGYNSGLVQNVFTTGQVEGVGYLGGVVGRNSYGTVETSWSSVTVTARYNNGEYLKTGTPVGGLVGGNWKGTILDSYARGRVHGHKSVGALTGRSTFKHRGVFINAWVERSYATGQVSGFATAMPGGLIGLSNTGQDNGVAASYWNTDTTGQADSAGGAGKTTYELQTPTGASGIYADWDANLWDFGIDSQYPALKVDFDGNGVATWQEFGDQVRTTPPAKRAADNNPPAFADSAVALSVAENTAAGTDIGGPVEATDPDGDTLTYTLGDTADDAHFAIDSGSGQLQTKGALDYESQSSYTVTVTATDGGGLAASIAVPINLTRDYDRDADGLIEVVSLAQLHAVRWDLDGDGASENAGYGAAFPDAAAGMGCPESTCSGYELAADLDFDTDGSGDVDAADAYWNGGAGWDPLGGNVGLKRPSDPAFNAVFDGNGHTIANLHINRPGRKSVGLFGAVGRRGTIRNLSLTNANVASQVNVGALAGILFGVVETVHASGSVAGGENVGGLVGFVHEDGRIRRSYATASVTGAKTNVGGLVGHLRGALESGYATGSVTSGDTAGGLVGVLLGTVEASYATGAVQGGRNVGGLAGLNRGATVTASYWNTETTGQPGSKTTAELQSPTGATGIYADWDTNIWDFGSSSQYPALKADWDGDGQATAAEFGSQERAVANNPPAFADSATEFSVAENTAAGTNIGDAVAATDSDGDSLTYALGSTADDAHFAIESGSGQLKTSGALDYESQSSYAVTVTATDGGGLAASIAVTIKVDDVDETPRPGNVQAELQADGSVLVTWQAPARAGDDTFYRVRRRLDAADSSYQVIARRVEDADNDGAIQYRDDASSLAAEQSYFYSVRAYDGDGDNIGKWTEGVKVSIPAAAPGEKEARAANNPPTFTAASAMVSVAENTVAGTNIDGSPTAIDLDAGDTLTYTMGSTADDGHFVIDAGSGQLKTSGALDYETAGSYTVTVTATDGEGLAASIAITISVTNVNEAPAFAVGAATVSVAENTAAGVVIDDSPSATDLDGDSLTYTLGSTAADGHFAIDAGSGQLKTSGALDYESTDSYTVTVTATDGGGLAASIAVTIKVDDVDETPRPGNVQAELQADGSVLVTWEAPAGAGDDTFYRVRRRLDAADSKYQVIARRVEDADNDGAAEYRDDASSLAAEQSYFYSVRAYDGDGDNIGKWTNGVRVSIPAN